MSEKQGAKNRYKKASEIQASEIKILQGTVFDKFGGLPQGFIGIAGQAGAGNLQCPK
ncbi:hypothetical protein [Aquifex sp.]